MVEKKNPRFGTPLQRCLRKMTQSHLLRLCLHISGENLKIMYFDLQIIRNVFTLERESKFETWSVVENKTIFFPQEQ